jgi:deoxyribonuclease V
MPSHPLLPWPRSLPEARSLQIKLRDQILLQDPPHPIRLLGAVDIGYCKEENWAWAAALLYRYPGLELLEERYLRLQIDLPYVPGFLSFREGPALLEVLSLLQAEPDLLLFDGQGIAHPQGLGLASHLGVLLGKSTIGCAKSRLVGEFEPSLLNEEKGSWIPLIYEGSTVGAAVRTRAGVKPLFISPGHLITLNTAIQVILSCCRRFRLPEPLRQAHLRVQLRKGDYGG